MFQPGRQDLMKIILKLLDERRIFRGNGSAGRIGIFQRNRYRFCRCRRGRGFRFHRCLRYLREIRFRVLHGRLFRKGRSVRHLRFRNRPGCRSRCRCWNRCRRCRCGSCSDCRCGSRDFAGQHLFQPIDTGLQRVRSGTQFRLTKTNQTQLCIDTGVYG